MAQQSALLPGVRARFFDDLRSIYEKSKPWDLVIFTGDLTCKGSAEEFEKVDEFLTRLWDCFRELGAKPSLLAVPGNHDLTRPDPRIPWVRLLKNDWNTDQEIRNDFWTNPESGYRKTITEAFENYVRWWEDTQFKLPAQAGELPGDFSAVLKNEGASLGIVGLNTAFLQLTGGDYKGKLALDPIQFNRACDEDGPDWVKRHNACLLLTHHPPDWLTLQSQAQLKAEIAGYDNFAVHLFGHMHEARYSAQADGGAPELRVFQATSLFGLKHFGESPNIERRHGYAVGRIRLEGDEGELTFWPRHAKSTTGQWNVVADSQVYIDRDEHTSPRRFQLKNALPTLGPSRQLDGVDESRSILVDKQLDINRWAFVMGVNDYQYFAKLRYCRKDAIDLANAFRTSLEFQHVFEFHEDSDLKPERDSIFNKLTEIQDNVKPEDLFVFYFSGHGINEGGKDYLLPIGAGPRNVKRLGILVEDLVDSLREFGCENTVMFIDACREAVTGTKGTGAIGQESRDLISRAGMIAFFSCDPRERSYEIETLEHGSFTYCILQAIQEGTISTATQLDAYLKEKVPQINKDYQKPVQRPYSVIVPPSRGELRFHITLRGPSRFESLCGQVTALRISDQVRIDVNTWVAVIEFLGSIEFKIRLDANETTKLEAIKALCDGRWPLKVFLDVWKALDVRRLAAPQQKSDLPPLKSPTQRRSGPELPTVRNQVFISYSHQDGKWLNQLQIMLKPLLRSKTISAWDDTKIRVGKKWKDEIKDGLRSARVAVLLVSPNFLASDFIVSQELPPLLEAAKQKGLTIIWVAVSHSGYMDTEIANYQAANDPSHPLDSLPASEVNRVLVDICQKIKAAL
jgi:predicted phosphodiesterase